MWLIIITALTVIVQCTIAEDLEETAFNYLNKYGYVDILEGTRPSKVDKTLSDALKKFHKFTGLEITGRIDKETKELMRTPRCGLDDRVANFVARDSKWEKRELTYRIFTYPTNGLSRKDVDSETTKAFAMWQEVSNLRFTKRSSGPVDIEISFAKGAHGDRNPFNGPGGVLAHAYFPGYGAISGDAHFDDAENWSVTPRGNQLLNTLTHEFAHSLGLEHSNVPGSIMAPYYKGWDTNLRLIDDDIKGIQHLYGMPTKDTPVNVPPVEEPTETPRKEKKLCQSKIDAITHVYGGRSFVFTGNEYWKLNDDGVAPGFPYPLKISMDWPGLPGNIDAAVTRGARGVTYFFKGDKYWRFTGQTPSSGYPKDIFNWPGLPANLDAAFEWGDKNDLYFFKGSQYWKYCTDRQTMDDSYPRDISIWKGGK